MSPGHRFSHGDCRYPLLYLGSNLQTCLWEVFGNDVFERARTIARSRWEHSQFSEVAVPELKLCAVSTERTRSRMSVDKGNLLAADLSIPQTWGLAIQQHPAEFDAIHYTSRFVDQPCLALFGRPELQQSLKVTKVGALDDLDEAVDWLNKQQATLV